MKKVLIVDDEKMARERILELIAPYPLTLAGEADSAPDAVNKINALKPDVVFLDIELHDKTAFDVIPELTHHPIIIYTTAHNSYALDAFNTSEIAIEYLLKPIQQEDMERAVSKIDSMTSAKDQHQALVDLLDAKLGKDYMRWINCKVGEFTYMIKVDDIKFIQSQDKYTNLHTVEKKVYPVTTTLSDLESKLNPEKFTRIHRSTIVNRDFIKKGRKGIVRPLELEIIGEDKCLEVSRKYAASFKQ